MVVRAFNLALRWLEISQSLVETSLYIVIEFYM